MTNAELAARALGLADEHKQARKIALTLHAALRTTTTTAGARRVLREWQGPADVISEALELLDQLEGK